MITDALCEEIFGAVLKTVCLIAAEEITRRIIQEAMD